MAHATNIDDRALNAIVQQAGRLIGALTDSNLLALSPIELRETFDVWMLRLDTIAYGAAYNIELTKLATDIGRYHHQITFAGLAEAFARSSLPVTPQGSPTLEELFVSPLAKRIDEAIEWIDQTVTDDPLVRLLVVPSHYLSALWLAYSTGPSRVLIVDVGGAPSIDFEHILNGLKANQLHDSSAFLQALSNTLPALGVCPGLRSKP